MTSTELALAEAWEPQDCFGLIYHIRLACMLLNGELPRERFAVEGLCSYLGSRAALAEAALGIKLPIISPASHDPYHDRKPYHLAKLISQDGAVSPLCASKPRALNLKRELWTRDRKAVTCKRCLAKMAGEAESNA
jgi:hypothetical protein